MKQCQIVAREKDSKTRAYKAFSELHKRTMKPALYIGLVRSYDPTREDAARLAPETKNVQLVADDVFGQAREILSEYWNLTATRDMGNMLVKADVTVDDTVLLGGLPVPLLIFLEKQLIDVRKWVDSMPTLSAAESWQMDENDGLWKTDTKTSIKTQKVSEPVVVIPPTTEHPGQWTDRTKDVEVGVWRTVHMCGAMTAARKRAILSRVQKLIDAVIEARQEANTASVPNQNIADTLFDYIFGA